MARAPRRPRPHNTGPPSLSGHRRLALAAAVVATMGLTVVGVAEAKRGQPAPSEPERQIEDQIDAMVDSGIPENDPKVELLEDQVAELRRGTRADPPPGAAGQATTGGVPTGPAWQSGTVECEPVPQVLTAAEVAGATCVSVPQPDGSSRHVAGGDDDGRTDRCRRHPRDRPRKGPGHGRPGLRAP